MYKRQDFSAVGTHAALVICDDGGKTEYESFRKFALAFQISLQADVYKRQAGVKTVVVIVVGTAGLVYGTFFWFVQAVQRTAHIGGLQELEHNLSLIHI